MHFYITGDTHGDFTRIGDFCELYQTTKEDVLIILGDAGINYHMNKQDRWLKGQLSELNITLFCVHGNHEARPWETRDYELKKFCGAMVYVEEEFPNILFAKDGEIYDFNGQSVIVIGGAYSVDKYYRLSRGMMWFDTEQSSEYIGLCKAIVEGIKTGYFDIVAHPDRSFRRCKNWTDDMERAGIEIIKTAKEQGVLLERNYSSMRHKRHYWKQFWSQEVLANSICGYDAHSVSEMEKVWNVNNV